MNERFYAELLEQWCPPSTGTDARFVRIFRKVRDIPYGSKGEREPEIIVRNNLGSCSGKHILLHHLFKHLGLRNKIMTCFHYFDQALPADNDYPQRLSEIINNHHVIDFHHFIKLKIQTKWLNVDATWDRPLSAYGFPVNLGWKGQGSSTVAVHPIKFYPETSDIIGLKKRLLAGLSPAERQIRAEFLKHLTDWFQDIRS